MRLEDAGNGSYEVFFSRGDTSKVKGKFWARVLDGVDPTKKGATPLRVRGGSTVVTGYGW